MLRVQFCSVIFRADMLVGTARGMGVPWLKHNQQSWASVGLEIFSARWVAVKMSVVWVSRIIGRNGNR